MSVEESRRNQYRYANQCDELRRKLRQLDQDYDELRFLRSKVEAYRGDIVKTQAQRKQMLSAASAGNRDSLAFTQYRTQMAALVTGSGYVTALMKLDRSITAVQQEMTRVSAESDKAESDLRYAQSMYTYWKNQADLGL